jgi:hypothetical protein
VIGAESPSFKPHDISANLGQHLSKVLGAMSQEGKEILKVNYEEFSLLFVECLKKVKDRECSGRSSPSEQIS